MRTFSLTTRGCAMWGQERADTEDKEESELSAASENSVKNRKISTTFWVKWGFISTRPVVNTTPDGIGGISYMSCLKGQFKGIYTFFIQ